MFRDMPDGFLPDWFGSLETWVELAQILAIDVHGDDGSDDLTNATRELANQGKCFDEAMKTLKLPKYESWTSYGTYLQGNIERFCEYWGRGI